MESKQKYYWSGEIINLHGHASSRNCSTLLIRQFEKKMGRGEIKINPRKRFLRLGENFDSN